jgi:hypothetical protein
MFSHGLVHDSLVGYRRSPDARDVRFSQQLSFQRPAEGRRGSGVLGEKQNAGCFSVEAVNQTEIWEIQLPPDDFNQRIRPALVGRMDDQARRLIDGHDN